MKKKVLIITVALVLTASILSLAACNLFGNNNSDGGVQRYFVEIGDVEDSRVASIVANNTVGSCVRICVDYKSGLKSRSTGFFVNEEGYIITNRHCVVRFTDGSDLPSRNNKLLDADIYVVDVDGNTYNAELVKYSTTVDIAVIKVKFNTIDSLLGATATFTPLTFDVTNLPYYGDRVYTMGNPDDLGFVFSELMIASPAFKLNDTDEFSTILLDGNINHGNSGGPLIDVNSRVVGIIYARVEGSGDTYGIGCAIPAVEITNFLKELNIKHYTYEPSNEDSSSGDETTDAPSGDDTDNDKQAVANAA